MPATVISIVVAMLLISAGPLPYAYYSLLRVVVTAASVFAAYSSFRNNARTLTWIFSFVALLFNPVLRVTLPKEFWMVIDLAVAILFFATRGRLQDPGSRSA